MKPLPQPTSSSPPSAASVPTLRWSVAEGLTAKNDHVASEAPLAIEVEYEAKGVRVRKVLAITMRTPGTDAELGLGFLLGEGVIWARRDVDAIRASGRSSRGEVMDTVTFALRVAPGPAIERAVRGTLSNSGCGLCGRTTLQGLPTSAETMETSERLAPETILSLPEKLRAEQTVFHQTGGCHGAGLAEFSGRLFLVREDVGRHNAVDKLVGAALTLGTDFPATVLVLSGRASFELVQKASAAGIPAIVAVGAPSSAAIELARANGLTLAGFTRDEHFNLYTGAARVNLTPLVAPSQRKR